MSNDFMNSKVRAVDIIYESSFGQPLTTGGWSGFGTVLAWIVTTCLCVCATECSCSERNMEKEYCDKYGDWKEISHYCSLRPLGHYCCSH